MTLLEDVASKSVLEAAYGWLYRRRKDYPDHADVWSFRFHWPSGKSRIQTELVSGGYRFEPKSVMTNRDGETGRPETRWF